MLFLFLCKRFTLKCTFNYLRYYSFLFQYFVCRFANVSAVRMKFLSSIRLSEQLFCQLTVMYFRTCYFAGIYQFTPGVYLGMVFVAVIFLSILFCPARI